MFRFFSPFRGESLTARTLRGSSWLIIGYGGSQAIRLASNLVLTRILFPEAFGVMALVTMVLVGLMMFSDVGITPAVQRSPRGDDPDFLNTAWTIQIVRGLILFGFTLVLAQPMAAFYQEPDLALYLPLTGIALIFRGFLPSRVQTARRHLKFGRLTAIDLVSQALGVGIMVILALVTESVLALVAGPIFTALFELALSHRYLEGIRNRPRIERPALHELVGFGSWVFLTTAFTFVSTQGDKAILGKFLSLDTFGIYNIGFFLASFPISMGLTVTRKTLIPVFRERPPQASAANRRNLRRLRFLVTGGTVAMLAAMAFLGPWLVDFLYDERYRSAGAMLVIVAAGLIPQAIGLTYDHAALAAGDSRAVFFFAALRSTAQIGALLGGLVLFGLAGGLAGYGAALLLVHPALVALARKHGAWDALHDGVFLILGGALTAAAVWLHLDALRVLAEVPLR